MNRTRTYRRRPVLAGVSVVLGALAAGPLGLPLAARAGVATAPPSGFPTPVPIDEITPGMTGTGLTVSRGTTPEPFTVTILGVLPNAIGPGVDMIVFEGDSPALDAAGGIWAGMSGSPVHTSDGRLIGAVAYGFTAAPSKIGGITPAVSMMELLTQPGAVPKTPAAKVKLPAKLRSAIVSEGHATAAQAAAGLAPLRIPLAVSGLRPNRIDRLNADFERAGSPLRAYAGSAAPGTAAPGEPIFPGSNFGAAASYGDLTLAAIGTTTAVADGKALAFGHPMLFTGPATMSAHEVNAVAVVQDATFGSFKLGTVRGVAGTVEQDRLVGLRASLGAGPSEVVPVTSTVRSGAVERTAKSWVTVDDFIPNVVVSQLLSNMDRVFDRIGPGRTTVTWGIRGTRAPGVPWRLDRTNRYASPGDAVGESVGEVADQVATILGNKFNTVKITNISLAATVEPEFRQYTVDGVQMLRNGVWLELREGRPILVVPGRQLILRVRLAVHRADPKLVEIRVGPVPTGSRRSGSLTVTGMGSAFSDPTPKSFTELLTGLRDAPHNDQLAVELRVGGKGGTRKVTNALTLDEVVFGEMQIPVTTL